tara:strand:+ start:845 stop:1030 length:186 start_codon:yes stop_codon:yes gene_type:complete
MPYCFIEDELLELIRNILLDCGYDESITEIEVLPDKPKENKCDEDCCKDKVVKRRTPLDDY